MFCFNQVMIGTSKNIWGFDPRSVPGCVVWLDAADSNTMTLSGSNITAWRDKSVLSNNVNAISATPPTFSSVDSSVNFSATSATFLRGALSDTYSNNATVFAVASITPTPELSAGVVTTFAGNGTGAYVNATGTNASFQFPSGVTVDGFGTVYISDTWNHRIRMISPLGVVSLLAGSGSIAFADGTGAGASFAYPAQIAIDNIGNLYVADTNNHRIRRIVISTGVVTTLVGVGTATSVDGAGRSATFNSPVGLTISKDNTLLFVTEANGNRIRQIHISSAVVTNVAGNGTSGSTDGVGTNATFGFPIGIAPDPFGNLYVANPVSHRVRKINIASRVVTTFAGSSLGTANGTGTNAQFNYPSGVTCDEVGNVYVAEADTPRIRKITPDGVVTTFAGSGTATSVDGTGTNATFSKPRGMFYFSDGIIYVADEVGHRIRKMNTKTMNLTYAQLSSLGSNAATENNLIGQSFEIQGVTPNLITFVENSTNPTGLGSNIQTYLSNNFLNTKLILANTSTYSGTTFGITTILNGAAQTFNSRTGTLATNSSNVNTYNKYAIGGMLNTTATVPTSFNGKLFEYLVFNNALTSVQRQQIEGYLAWKWGLAQYLPTTPLFIPGCQLWLDGSDRSSMTFSGSNITQWNDKSGNGYHATLESGKTGAIFSTTFNAVNFASSNTSYQTSYTAAPTNETMFIVFNNAAPSVFNAILIGSQLGGRAFGAGYSGAGGQQTINLVGNLKNGAAWLARTSPGSYISGTTAISTSQFTSSNNTISVNGGTAAIGGAPAFTAGTTTFLGVDKRTTIYYYIGHVMEMIFYNSILNTSQRQTIEGYLSKKWKISNMYVELSSNNPYFSLRPHLRTFQPSDISNCALWLDAADESTMTLSGSNVTQWRDKSGNGNNALANTGTVTTNSTRINGLNTIRFSTSSFLTISSFAMAANVSMFAVLRGVGAQGSGNFGYFFIGNGLQPSFFVYTLQPSFGNIAGPYSAWVASTGETNWYMPSSDFFLNNPGFIYTDNSTSFVNGSQLTRNPNRASVPNTVSAATYNNLQIGGRVQADSLAFDFAELLFYNNTLTTTQRQQVEGYLAHKWGLSSSLFSPLAIPGCQLWLDAADSSTVTGTTSVTQWRDKSGNGRNTTTTGTISYANSGISITSSSSYLTGSFGTPDYTGSTLTSFIVASMNSASGSVARLFSLGKVGTQDWDNLASITLGRGGGLLLRPYRTVPTSSPPSIPAYDTRFIGTWGQTSSLLFNSINGGALSTASISGAFAINAYRIGHDLLPDDANEQFNGTINEIVVYFSELTTSQRQQIEGYLSQKWSLGVSSTNPFTHPFYKFPPSSVPFSLSSIPGCQLWLDAADQSSLTLSGSNVTQWNDKSGNARHVTQVTEGLRPTYSFASNAIVFDGTRYLDIPNALSAITPTYTIFVVEKRASDQARFFVGGRVGSGGVALILGYNSSTISHHTTAEFSDMQVTIPSYLGASEPIRVTRFAYTGSTRSTFINGGQFSNSQGFSATLTTWNTANIGAGFGGPGFWYIGNVYEVLFYNSVLTTSQCQQVEGYLAQKWGLIESLPSTHPFKKLPTTPVNTLVSGFGGTVVTNVNTYHVFTSSSSFTVTYPGNFNYLVVGGGGGGGDRSGAGGGAGGVLSGVFFSGLNTYSITVGEGGIAANAEFTDTGAVGCNSLPRGTGLKGGNSSIIGGSQSITAFGGGGGGSYDGNPTGTFGSGGGGGGGPAGGTSKPGVAGTVGQGNSGGSGLVLGAGGGGGAGGAGSNANVGTGGNGTNLFTSHLLAVGYGTSFAVPVSPNIVISNSQAYIAGGGGGCAAVSPGPGGSGGVGGGGRGDWNNVFITAGTPNTGGGGGGARSDTPTGDSFGRPGGSGLVIIWY